VSVSAYVGDGRNRWPAVHVLDAARLYRLVPVISLSAEEVPGHFGWLAAFARQDLPASGALTRKRLGWQPAGPGLTGDLETDALSRN